MRHKNFLRVALCAMLLGLCAVAEVSAQVVQASGKVTLKQADGTEAPLPGATVTIYRTDIKGKYEVKTDKGGRWVYAGIPFTGVFTVIVSGPNAKPTFITDVRFSQKPDGNDFTLEPGDGSVLTLEQVQAAGGSGGGANRPAGGGGDSAATRKAREEMAKQQAAVDAENKKNAETNVKLNDVLKAGNEAFNAKKYDEAITSYDQGIQADPTQSIFYLNKSVALRMRGVDKYNVAAKAKDNAGRDAARADFKAAAEAGEKGLTTYREASAKRGAAAGGNGGGAAAPAAAGGGGAAHNDELMYLASRSESYRVALQTSTQVSPDDAAKAIQEYVTKETDPAKKLKAQTSLGDALFQGGKIDEAVAAYQQTLTSSPDNLDAMYGMGVALLADPSPSADKVTQARTMLQKFIAKAPDTDPRKQEAAGVVESLKAGNNKAETETGKTPPARRKG